MGIVPREPKPLLQSQSSGSGAWSSWSASTPASSTSISAAVGADHKPLPTPGKPESSSYSQSPITPGSHASFVPHSLSSGSGAWSSWSASTPASSTSISAAHNILVDSDSDHHKKPISNSYDPSVKVNLSQESFVPITGSMVWSWKSAGKNRPEAALVEQPLLESDDTVPEIPQKFQHQMTRLVSLLFFSVVKLI
jgi:hypothetical protein